MSRDKQAEWQMVRCINPDDTHLSGSDTRWAVEPPWKQRICHLNVDAYCHAQNARVLLTAACSNTVIFTVKMLLLSFDTRGKHLWLLQMSKNSVLKVRWHCQGVSSVYAQTVFAGRLLDWGNSVSLVLSYQKHNPICDLLRSLWFGHSLWSSREGD